jgi:glucose/mannose-6-phosphate isomerase
MKEIINSFNQQFAFEPKIENEDRLTRGGRFIVAGMGGSNLAAGLIKTLRPKSEILIHRDYGLPMLPDACMQEGLVIVSSYSGNTAETLSAFDEAKRKGLHMAVITTGGELLKKAQEAKIPYVLLPNTNIPPRMALGFSFVAHLKLMGEEELLREVQNFADILKPNGLEEIGRGLADKISERIPLIYSSCANETLAYNWKVRLNETGKIPAFCGLAPELAHNEIAGFDRELPQYANNFFIIFLRDEDDNPEVAVKMDRLEAFFADNNISFEKVIPVEEQRSACIFASIIIADWTSYHIALNHGLNPLESRAIDDFKKFLGGGGGGLVAHTNQRIRKKENGIIK